MINITKTLATRRKQRFSELVSQFEDQNALIEHVLQNILFFDRDSVHQQAADLSARIARSLADRTEAIPIVYSSKVREDLCVETKGDHARYRLNMFGKDTQLGLLSCCADMIHKPTDVRILLETADNRYLHEQIYRHTGNIMDSWYTPNRDSKYTLLHIWDKTDDPYCYSALWNMLVVPRRMKFFWNDDLHACPQYTALCATVRAIAYLLFEPEALCAGRPALFSSGEKAELQPYLDFARSCIESGKIYYVKNLKNCPEEQELQMSISSTLIHQKHWDDTIDEAFVQDTLERVSTNCYPQTTIFTDAEATAKICRLDSPLLFDITGMSEAEIEAYKHQHAPIVFGSSTFAYADRVYLVRIDLKSENKGMLFSWSLVGLI